MTDILKPFISLLDQLNNRQDLMLKQAIDLARINSGSYNAEGVNKVNDKLIEIIQILDAEHSVVEVKPLETIDNHGNLIKNKLGNALVVIKRPEAPLQVVLSGHMDTVFPKDSIFQDIKYISKDYINGPGLSDMKGGIVVMIHALSILERSPWTNHIGWKIIFNPDEEIGSKSSNFLFEDASKKAHIGLLYEPCFPDGSLAGSRKGSGNFSIVATGKAAHAGREHHLGRNALRPLFDIGSAIDDLNGQIPGLTVNVAKISGGGVNNVVPDKGVLRFNVRIEKYEQEVWFFKHLTKIIKSINQEDGINLMLHGNFTRKPKVLTKKNLDLLRLAVNIGSELNMSFKIKPTGGCCDGNNLAILGVPNIDNLGVQGGDIHSDNEYMKISSLVPRAKLSATLLMKMAKDQADSITKWIDKV